MEESGIYAQAKEKSNALKEHVAVLDYRLEEADKTIQTLEQDEERRVQYITNLEVANKWLQQLVERINTENINKIHLLVNQALSFIFFDQNLEFKIVSEIKRNQTVYRCVVLDNGVEGNLQSFGGGVWCVIAAVLKIIFNRLTKRFPMLVFDESLSFLADKYVPNASAFLKEFSEKFDMPIILVTHNSLFVESADIEWRAVQTEAGSYFKRMDKNGKEMVS